MKKAESFTPPSAIQTAENATYNPDAHGYAGPVGASYPIPYRTFKLYEAFVSAAQTVFGIARGIDFCDGNPNIASQTASSIHPSADGTTSLRSSSAVAYLYPIAPGPDHTGLQVLTNHQAHRITWSSSKDSNGNAVATGVEFSSTFLGKFGPTSSVKAKKEVIVSAGAIMSPHVSLAGALVQIGAEKNYLSITAATIEWSWRFFVRFHNLVLSSSPTSEV